MQDEFHKLSHYLLREIKENDQFINDRVSRCGRC
jgi:hypothetical protein